MVKTNKSVILKYLNLIWNTTGKKKFKDDTSIDAICKECKGVYKEQWKNSNGKNEKKCIQYASLMNHLRTHREIWEKEVEPQLHTAPPAKRKSIPANSNATGYNENEFKSRIGACFICGIAINFSFLGFPRCKSGYASKFGCPKFSTFYNERHFCTELQNAIDECGRHQMSTEEIEQQQQAKNRQKFLEFAARDRDTVPIRKSVLEDNERKHGVYAQIWPDPGWDIVDKIAYFGRTDKQTKRERSYRLSNERLPVRGMLLPDHSTVLVGADLTLFEASLLEYLCIQLKDPYGNYKRKLMNSKLPIPIIQHSRSTGGENHMGENRKIHSEGRRIAAELLLDAVWLEKFVILEQGHPTEAEEEMMQGDDYDGPSTSSSSAPLTAACSSSNLGKVRKAGSDNAEILRLRRMLEAAEQQVAAAGQRAAAADEHELRRVAQVQKMNEEGRGKDREILRLRRQRNEFCMAYHEERKRRQSAEEMLSGGDDENGDEESDDDDGVSSTQLSFRSMTPFSNPPTANQSPHFSKMMPPPH